MNPRWSVGLISVLMISSSGLSAQTLRFSDFEGYSVVAEYEEEVVTRRRGSFRATWRDRVYFSTKGRIFHRFQRQDSRPNRDRDVENVGDEDGLSEDKKSVFRWSGDGITREWTNNRGIRIRQSIAISRSGDGFACRVSIDRSSIRGSVVPIGRSCRVFKGNVLAG